MSYNQLSAYDCEAKLSSLVLEYVCASALQGVTFYCILV